jgi:DsbC/DsbD-like thiol-disulfide interchange protein
MRFRVPTRLIALIFGAVIMCASQSWCQSAQAADDATASPWVEGYNSRVRLISGAGRAGIELSMPKGWKTYWRMPGDTGVPPGFDWAGSTNVAKVDVLYPAPIRMVDQGGTAIGYQDRVIFPLTITPVDADQPVVLTLAFEYGVCKDICIPAEAKLSLTLRPGQTSGHHGPRSPDLEQAIERVPRVDGALKPGDPRMAARIYTRSETSPRIRFDVRATGDPNAVDLFVEGPAGVFIPFAKRSLAANGLVQFNIDLSKVVDIKDIIGQPLRITMTSASGASETTWTPN